MKFVFKILLLNILAALLATIYVQYKIAKEVSEAVKAEEDRVVSIYELKLSEARLEASITEKKLLESSSKNIKERDDKISRLNNSLTIALNSLRERPSRPSDNSSIAENSCPSTGAQLYREDGEFLTREAARAERLIAERDFYYSEYEKARIALEELRNKLNE